jgi:hypothetical protein
MHAASILAILVFDINGVDMGVLVLVIDLIDLVLEEFVIVPLLIVHNADYQQECLNYDALYGAEIGRGLVTVLQ